MVNTRTVTASLGILLASVLLNMAHGEEALRLPDRAPMPPIQFQTDAQRDALAPADSDLPSLTTATGQPAESSSGELPAALASTLSGEAEVTDVLTEAADGPKQPQSADGAAAAKAAEKAKEKKPPKPFKLFFFDNDFSYLDNPDNDYYYFTDFLKRRHLGEHVTLDVGGEYRLRQHNEYTILRKDNFLLERTRLYGDVHYDDWFRTYVEAIDATSMWENSTPKTSDENRFDALDMFADARLLKTDDGAGWIRGGRQQLNYGNQRVIGGRDWTNAMLAYDGAKGFWRSKAWDVDAFWLRPVPVSQHVNQDHNFDHPDPLQEFYGVYATRKDIKDQTFDYYFLRYDNFNAPAAQYNTFGSRWQGACSDWLWEFEGAYQFGDVGGLAQAGGFYTIGGGRKMSQIGWKPVLWFYYDWASGDHDPNDSRVGTYNQLFPTAHRYFGYMDIIARQNIEDWNCQLTLTPHPQLELMAWYHVFHLQSPKDALYNSSGTAVRQDATGAAGSDVGQEIDLTARWLITPRTDLYLGYCHFFPGHFLDNTTGGGFQQDFVFTQFATKF